MNGVSLETPLLYQWDREDWNGKQKSNQERKPRSCASTVPGGGEGFVVLPLFHQTHPTVSSRRPHRVVYAVYINLLNRGVYTLQQNTHLLEAAEEWLAAGGGQRKWKKWPCIACLEARKECVSMWRNLAVGVAPRARRKVCIGARALARAKAENDCPDACPATANNCRQLGLGLRPKSLLGTTRHFLKALGCI